MAYAALNVNISLETWMLFIANLCWVVAYDTEYAIADRTDDLALGIKSTAISFGAYDKVIILLLQLSSLAIFIILGMQRAFSLVYYIPLFAALLLIIYQQYLIKDYNPERCIQAFKNNNYVGMLLFCTVLLATY